MTAATVTSWLATAVDVDPADRSAWLDWRRGGIGASDIAGILGISPWASPFSVWADKVGVLPEEEPSTVMKAGRWLERGVAPWFADETGFDVAGEQTACQHSSDPIARCTLDGAVFTAAEHEAPDGGLEIKVEGPGRAPRRPSGCARGQPSCWSAHAPAWSSALASSGPSTWSPVSRRRSMAATPPTEL